MDPFSILIVDDNEDDRYILKRQLNSAQLPISKVFEASDGQKAVDFFENDKELFDLFDTLYPPKFVFLDINMPLMNGFEFLEQFEVIRKKFALDAIIIVMFSSSEREKDKQVALSHSFVKGYFIKGSFGVNNLTEQITLLAQS
ncbi:response regulator [Pseudoalteromonas luteoviolacea]|uniref:Response regulatory domain-containing protein n=1 Tax=Pseudoalteromonas luteoviolacea S4054 TaxID=1129367 RepID=A0A0F6A636_9GAMM|nr:response regulator [Pseudoalteromonas luteoviolacea]AOT07752.1 hypothetical protein S4054249_07825 [Pseudoalteromonas luteoviolacea]AOT12668.1 hypothetical protein S40542_07825 [Pseudoalteromonas luteoviolacea]AOT17581.1 hypothetical protein S4054_07820 [Pseudoalteromonas luteoviolacea]KKE81578.1 hypothetical protein N479_22030 [Pseudoalteromonas luteoviolacea S4054]KZN78886.1 hypothetical protein N481_00155 [Pseudoalteromonas luteoviolacea S4047-1]